MAELTIVDYEILRGIISFVREQLQDNAIDLDCFPAIEDNVAEAERVLRQIKP